MDAKKIYYKIVIEDSKGGFASSLRNGGISKRAANELAAELNLMFHELRNDGECHPLVAVVVEIVD